MLRLVSGAALAAAALALALPGAAAAKSCSSKNAVIKQSQQIIYFDSKGYKACYVKTGRVTRLSSGSKYSPSQVAGHGTHATVVESIFSFDQGESAEQTITMWNVKTGKKFSTTKLTPTGGNVELIDSPFGDPVTAIFYRLGGIWHLDALTDKGFVTLSDKSVKTHSVSIDAKRVVHWAEGSKKRAKRV